LHNVILYPAFIKKSIDSKNKKILQVIKKWKDDRIKDFLARMNYQIRILSVPFEEFDITFRK